MAVVKSRRSSTISSSIGSRFYPFRGGRASMFIFRKYSSSSSRLSSFSLLGSGAAPLLLSISSEGLGRSVSFHMFLAFVNFTVIILPYVWYSSSESVSPTAGHITAALLRLGRFPVVLRTGKAWESTCTLSRMFNDDTEESSSTNSSIHVATIPPASVRLF